MVCRMHIIKSSLECSTHAHRLRLTLTHFTLRVNMIFLAEIYFICKYLLFTHSCAYCRRCGELCSVQMYYNCLSVCCHCCCFFVFLCSFWCVMFTLIHIHTQNSFSSTMPSTKVSQNVIETRHIMYRNK